MCTGIFDNKVGAVFGRTLDLERSFGEELCEEERGKTRKYIHLGEVESKYRVCGMAHKVEGVPLFYDGMNECGLAIAALNFPKYAVYLPPHDGYINLGSFEVIPYILGQCSNVRSAKVCLERINITRDSFSDAYPSTPLHFMIADRECALIAEPRNDGIRLYDTRVG